MNGTFCRRSFQFFGLLLAVSLLAEFIANDRPIAIEYGHQYYFPIFRNYSETLFGGDLDVTADYRDPHLQQLIKDKGGVIVWAPIRFSYATQNSGLTEAAPSKPTWMLSDSECQSALKRMQLKSCGDLEYNWLGTDDQGRDVMARLVYGVRLAMLIAISTSLAWLIVNAAIRALFGRRARQPFGQLLLKLPTVFGASIAVLVTLDFQGLGLSLDWPSLGEMLRQAHDNPQAIWLWLSAGGALALLLAFTLSARCALRSAFGSKGSDPASKT